MNLALFYTWEDVRVYFCFIDYAKAFNSVDHNKLWKILREMGISDYPTSWETCMNVKEQQLELNMEQWTGSKVRKESTSRLYIVTMFV